MNKNDIIYNSEVPNIPITLRTMTLNEHKYAFEQSQQIKSQCGLVGCLRGDFSSTGTHFYSTWFDGISSLKTDEFKSEFDDVINALRDDPKYRGILHNLKDMILLCSTRPNSKMTEVSDTRNCGFRADTEKYAYLIRCIPYEMDYNFYIYAYKRESLNRHIQNADKGIRFITPEYNELFNLKDGGKIRISHNNGETVEKVCRYIDEYHTEIGSNFYHICEFAELMQKNGNTIEPVSEDDLQPKSKRHITEPERQEMIVYA